MSRLPLSLRLARGVLAAAPLLAALQACGRSEPGDYLFDDGTSGSVSGGKSGSASTAGKPSKGGTPGKGGSGATAGTVGVAGEAGSAFGGIGGTGTGGSGIGGTVVGGFAGEGAGGEPNIPIVACGNTSCDTAVEQCCASLAGFGCISKKLTCNGAVLDCTSADDCSGGDVCCLSFTAPTGSASTCKNRCVGTSSDLERQLCSTDAECAGNRRCAATIFGVNVCTRRP